MSASSACVDELLASPEPSIRYKTLTGVLGRAEDDPDVQAAREAIRTSPRTAALLAPRTSEGRIPGPSYKKWTGAHWVLACLADLGYPPGDKDLLPIRDQVYETWLAPEHTRERVLERETRNNLYGPGVPVVRGRARRCGSQEGNALYATLALGLADERADQLASNLIHWQWPDGGWNCDRNPSADTSSFMESLIPLRALALHARVTGSRTSAEAAERAAQVFLSRKLFRRRSDGRVIHPSFIKLHYPLYWHYDILGALKVLGEAGFIGHPNCTEALDLLESKRLPDGGFPAEAKFYTVSTGRGSNISPVDWGGTSKTRMNLFVTVDALTVLRLAGR